MEGKLGCIVGLVLLVAVFQSHAQDESSPLPVPADLGRPHEPLQDLTIDEAIAKAHAERPSSPINEHGNILVEGDMYVSKDRYAKMYGPQTSSAYSKRSATSNKDHLWPNAIMPYTIKKTDFNDWEQYTIHRSMTQWEKYTCFKFVPKDNTHNYSAEIRNGYGGCNSELGFYNRNPQHINLYDNGCHYMGLYLHEIGHAMGLIHEQQRPDRDNWISIIRDNVAPALRIWFDPYKPDEVGLWKEVEYEYSSIMHYGIRAFSIDGKKQTIKAKYPDREHEIGKVFKKELAYGDVKVVNLLYKCADHCPRKKRCGKNGHLDENCNCICKDGTSNCDKTKPKRKTAKSCKNAYWSNWRCNLWANEGECERNAFYMKEWCAKACGFCGPKVAPPSACVDVYQKNNKCRDWATRGDCVTNREWMKRNCPETCNYCEKGTSPEEDCEDEYTFGNRCLDKARDGDCIADPVGMHNNCRKSCRWCNKNLEEVSRGIVVSKFKESMVPCEDKNDQCAPWAKVGECERNPTWMINNCPLSCNRCDDGTCKNLYNDVECDKKAAEGNCMTDPNFMSLRCALSCRRGVCMGIETPPTTVAPYMPTTDPTCFDRVSEKTCKDLMARTDVCTERRMLDCKKSCGICGCREVDPDQCPVWAAGGQCQSSPSYMLKNCQKSCKICDGDDSSTSDVTEKPTDPNCNDKLGETTCESRINNICYTAEVVNCKKTCGICGCKEVQPTQCAGWAASGMCDTNPGYMLANCQKSCKLC